MLLEEYDRKTGRVRSTTTRFGRFKCDSCGREYDRAMSHRRSKRDSCSLKCVNKGRVHTEEWKQRTSIRMRGEGNHYFGHKHNSVIRQRISDNVVRSCKAMSVEERKSCFARNVSGNRNPFFGKQHTDDSRQRMSQTRVNAISEGRLSSGPRGRKGTYLSSKTNLVERYDSFFELLRMKMLDADDTVMSWTKIHGIRIPYEWQGQHHYVPDFQILTEHNTFIEEIKGYENPEKLRAKISALNVYCHEHGYEPRYLTAEEFESMVHIHFGTSIAKLRRTL